MPSDFSRFGAVIPAFNESGKIGRAILDTKRVLGEHAEIIVVDDGSTDSTSIEAVRAGARVITHDVNRGKGAAVKTGALASVSEWLLVLDADLSTQPSELERFYEHLHHSDILFGSRRVNGASITKQQPWYRVKAGQMFNWLMRAVSGLPYHDTQCGFKAYRMSSCRQLFELQITDGWSFDAELLMRAQQTGLRLTELPITWSHTSGSKVRLFDAPSILLDLWRLRRVIPQTSLDGKAKS